MTEPLLNQVPDKAKTRGFSRFPFGFLVSHFKVAFINVFSNCNGH